MSEKKMDAFSPEVCKELKHYVYRLIDPRNGQTFYVGQGVGNRVFAHVHEALGNYMGEKYLEKDEDKLSYKIERIRDIKNAGLDVIHVIHRYGLETKEMASEVESAVMDCFLFSELSNIQHGNYSERGVANTYELQQRLSVDKFVDREDLKYIIIKSSTDRINKCREEHVNLSLKQCIYEATRYSWKISPAKAKRYTYVLGVIDGIVRGVYKPEKWFLSDNGVRYEFVGEDAPKEIMEYFINKRLPDKYTIKGAQNPIRYSI